MPGKGLRLSGERPDDPALFALVAAVLLLAALGAGWRPAVRAFRMDPAQALRGD